MQEENTTTNNTTPEVETPNIVVENGKRSIPWKKIGIYVGCTVTVAGCAALAYMGLMDRVVEVATDVATDVATKVVENAGTVAETVVETAA